MSREIDNIPSADLQPEDEPRIRLYSRATFRHLSGILLMAGGFIDAAIALGGMEHGSDTLGPKAAIAAGLALCAAGIYVEQGGGPVSSPVDVPEAIETFDHSLINNYVL
ncbi:MAG: hypothetical protein WDN66_02470 [Candidatus Saccharibacteria bacterium]